MKMRICHVTSVHNAFDTRIYHKMCKSLSKEYDVYLVAPNVENQESEGIHIVGVNLPQGRLKRMLNLDGVLKAALNVDASIYHLHDPELIPTGLKLKKHGKIVIFDSHEDIPIDVSEKSWIPKVIRPFVASYYKRYEKNSLEKYDALVSVTPSIVERLLTINPHTFQITNYPALSEFIDERKWGDSICFAGNVSRSWMLSNIADSIKDYKIPFRIVGPCYTPDFGEYIRQMKGVEYSGKIPHKAVRPFTQESTVGMALYDYLPSFGYKRGSLGNNKMFEYMASGIPVIATDFDLWKEIIDKYHCGICVNPHDKDAILNAIKYYIDNKDVAQEHGNNGRKAVEEFYNWSSQEKVLFDMYKSLE